MRQESRSAPANGGKYLTFQIDEEIYGVEILKVQEIIGLMNITKVPRTPADVRGVINLRGKVIPVVDLRIKFGLHAVEATEKTCIIVVQVQAGGVPLIIGIVVDNVRDVLDIQAEEIEPAPSFGESVRTDFILGIGKVGANVVTMLDIEEVLCSDGFRPDAAALCRCPEKSAHPGAGQLPAEGQRRTGGR